jgi:predicted ATP-dependent serine protease
MSRDEISQGCIESGMDFPHWWGWCWACQRKRAEIRNEELNQQILVEMKRRNDLLEQQLSGEGIEIKRPARYTPEPTPTKFTRRI